MHARTLEPIPFKRPDGGQVDVIVEAAEACFSRSGYAGASMREIAEKAGVSKSLLHYHFDSKEHLFVEVQIRFYERLGARIAAAVAHIPGGDARGLAAFDALFEVLRQSNDLATQAELWAAALANEKLRAQITRLREFFRQMLVARIEEILGADRERLPVTPEAAADLVWATLNGLGIEAAFGEPQDRIERAITTLRVLSAIALSPRPTPPDAGQGAGAGSTSPRAGTSPAAGSDAARPSAHDTKGGR
jgi:AcrR family transcriptional regulator